ncbi:GAF domain-containing sensor histidine kinase [Nocardioides sp.]|uniref:sensor histidine kinase n=1 Tax=Nocardioides sp. TaxID=35761 RepID=UPI002B27A2FE|nr:GAF domain-containing sensor histidine kinase [Nocardioides sp.]
MEQQPVQTIDPQLMGDAAAMQGLVEVMALLHSAVGRHAVLDAVVSGVRDALGFSMAAIRVLEEDGRMLHTAAVVGPPDATASLQGRTLPLSELVMEFGWAERDEDVYFVPWERLPDDIISTWVPEAPIADGPDAWHPMDALYVRLNDDEGRLLGVLGVDLPVSGRRPDAHQRQLLQLYARHASLALQRTKMIENQSRLVASLLAAQQESDSMVATLTHDLKSPLTVILGHAELARDGLLDDDDPVAVRLDSVLKAVRRMQTTIDALLTERESAHDEPVHVSTWEPVDLAAMAGELVAFSGVVADRRRLTLELAVGEGDAVVEGDPRELIRAIDNLVSNALKYTPPGGHVVLGVECLEDEVVVTCADDGLGIPVAEQREVFGAYARAARAKAEGIEGSGLGLPSARRTVETHGGTLTLASAPGDGATFTARFPRPSTTRDLSPQRTS